MEWLASAKALRLTSWPECSIEVALLNIVGCRCKPSLVNLFYCVSVGRIQVGNVDRVIDVSNFAARLLGRRGIRHFTHAKPSGDVPTSIIVHNCERCRNRSSQRTRVPEVGSNVSGGSNRSKKQFRGFVGPIVVHSVRLRVPALIYILEGKVTLKYEGRIPSQEDATAANKTIRWLLAIAQDAPATCIDYLHATHLDGNSGQEEVTLVSRLRGKEWDGRNWIWSGKRQ